MSSQTQRQFGYLHDHAAAMHLPKEWRDGVPAKRDRAHGIVLLTDDADVSSVVDGEVAVAVAYPAGTYVYTAVSGGQKTVRKYTASLRKALDNR
jgi:hypothetical protein